MRENQVDSLLSKFIKRAAARNNISEKRMVVFNVRFFIGRIGITKEEMTFFIGIRVAFKSKNIAEFPTVISQNNRENIAEREP